MADLLGKSFVGYGRFLDPISRLSGRFHSSHDGVVSADAFITCRVTPETKARVRKAAELQGLNESALLRQLLQVAIGGTAPVDGTAPLSRDRPGREQRISVGLTVEDRQRLTERATARGVASATYVALLVRSHLLRNAPLPKAEYLLLRQSVLELTAIGRNLNQIARAINLKGNGASPGRIELAAMLQVAGALRDHFKELLKANEASWSHHARAPH